MAHREDEGVDAVVAQGLGLLARGQLADPAEGVVIPAKLRHQLFHQGALAGSGVADVHPFARQIIQPGDLRVGTHHQGQRFRMQAEHRPQVRGRAEGLEAAAAVIGVVLQVRLGHAEVHVAGAHHIQIEHRAPGALRGAAHPVFVAAGVEQAAQVLAGRVVDPGDAAGTDVDEALLGRRQGRKQQQPQGQAQAKGRQSAGQAVCRGAVHGGSSHVFSREQAVSRV